ncbi:FMN-binding negative transcriptional regulator [Streptomyces boninensis]|uniref:FMN-binding negative transcriptional regulator n=1 Tax=Streptomyces boninensis TaxID=2039455 RepID=UPI003B220ABA
MLIHPWDTPRDDAEWQRWLAARDFGQLAVNGPPGEPPLVQPLHFAYEPERGEIVTHIARPNPLGDALAAAPEVLLSVVDDYAYIPGPWKAEGDAPPEHGVPTSFYAAVQLRCTAEVIDDPEGKAELLRRQMGHFQPAGDHAPVAVGASPYGRLLSGIRGIRLQVTGVRAKFKYAANKPEPVRERIGRRLAERGAPLDAAAREHVMRSLADEPPSDR